MTQIVTEKCTRCGHTYDDHKPLEGLNEPHDWSCTQCPADNVCQNFYWPDSPMKSVVKPAPEQAPNELTITVTGVANSGKSTIAQLVAEQLLQFGFRVKIVDEPFREGWHSNRRDRLRHIAGRDTLITVVTNQIPRKK